MDSQFILRYFVNRRETSGTMRKVFQPHISGRAADDFLLK